MGNRELERLKKNIPVVRVAFSRKITVDCRDNRYR